MKLNLIAPINQLGYGITSLNVLKALQNEGVNVALFPIGQPQITTEEDAERVKTAVESSRFFNPHAACIRIWHQHDLAQFVGCGKHIGFPIFELDTFNDLENHHLKSCDGLFVCSQWAKDVCVSNGVTNHQHTDSNYHTTEVVPLGVDTMIFKPCPPNDSPKTVFFNCGKWEVRKGHDILYKAFRLAFDGINDVELWMMCENPFNTPQEESRWTNLYNHSQIKLIPRVQTQKEVYNIMKEIDCGVFPSRAEGWNLEALEVMACGKQLIITNYSAHTEFCNSNNSLLVEIDDKEPAFDGKWFFGQGNWAKMQERQVQDLAKHMLAVYNLKKSNGDITNYQGIETAKQYSWKKSAESILNYV